MKKTFLLLTLAVLGMLTFQSCSNDDEDDVNPNQVPELIKDSLSDMFPGINSSYVKWEKEKNYYIANFYENNGRVETEVYFTQKGDWAMTESDLGTDLSLLPGEVYNGFLGTNFSSFPWMVDDIEYFDMPNQTFYIIEVEGNNLQDTYLFFGPDGSLINTVTNNIPDIYPGFNPYF